MSEVSGTAPPGSQSSGDPGTSPSIHIHDVALKKLIGQGEMAEVWHGRHTTLHLPVAVKVIHRHLADSEGILRRFRQETNALMDLHHPNIVRVHDFGVADGRPYIVMEYLAGPTLAALLEVQCSKGTGLDPAIALRVASRIASALAYAHDQGVIHRDVKPGNIVLRSKTSAISATESLPDDVEPVLMDFGVARLTDRPLGTAAGAFIGTPAYMSPEQVLGETADGRSDIYALGIILYQMLVGALPADLTSRTISRVLYAHLEGLTLLLPEELSSMQRILDRCVARKREARYPSAAELERDLQRLIPDAVRASSLSSLITRVMGSIEGIKARLPLPGAVPKPTPTASSAGGAVQAPITGTYLNPRVFRRLLLTPATASSQQDPRAHERTHLNWNVMRRQLMGPRTDDNRHLLLKGALMGVGLAGLLAAMVAVGWVLGRGVQVGPGLRTVASRVLEPLTVADASDGDAVVVGAGSATPTPMATSGGATSAPTATSTNATTGGNPTDTPVPNPGDPSPTPPPPTATPPAPSPTPQPTDAPLLDLNPPTLEVPTLPALEPTIPPLALPTVSLP
jgi:serine/threonine protein kinase